MSFSKYRIQLPLYTHPFKFYYDIYRIDINVPTFIDSVYQTEIITQLAINLEMG